MTLVKIREGDKFAHMTRCVIGGRDWVVKIEFPEGHKFEQIRHRFKEQTEDRVEYVDSVIHHRITRHETQREEIFIGELEPEALKVLGEAGYMLDFNNE